MIDPHTMNFDVAVIGAGIAGTSVAAELAKNTSVVLLEMESQPGYHTTGRSAAMFAPTYGPQPIRALTRASYAFFSQPPEQFCESPLLSNRTVMMVARDDQSQSVHSFLDEVSDFATVRPVGKNEALTAHPLLRPDYLSSAVIDTGSSEIDVNGLHQGYLRALRSTNGTLLTNCKVVDLKNTGGNWLIQTEDRTIKANQIINAAGAWADEIGQLAKAEPIELAPKRRTVIMVDSPPSLNVEHLPMVIDIDEKFYMKPEPGGFLISPANEDVVTPCDVQPEEIDIAICIDRIEMAFDMKIKAARNKWAGLRSFVADKCPVAGYSDQAESFFWLAGQGGYGIQTAPALARFSAAIVLGEGIPEDLLAAGLEPSSIMPTRF